MKRDNESNIRQIRDSGKLAAWLVYIFQSIEMAEAMALVTSKREQPK